MEWNSSLPQIECHLKKNANTIEVKINFENKYDNIFFLFV